MKILPDVPTIEQAGFKGGMEFSLWTAIFGPKGMPNAIVDTVNQAVMSSLASPKVRERLDAGGVEIAAPEKQSPASLAAIQQAEIKKWWPIIDAAGIKAQ
jgi:tripartite-type tricarboxylate transporter receptor subunit TctC